MNVQLQPNYYDLNDLILCDLTLSELFDQNSHISYYLKGHLLINLLLVLNIFNLHSYIMLFFQNAQSTAELTFPHQNVA